MRLCGMLRHRSAQIVEAARLAFVCTDKDSLLELPSMQYWLGYPSHSRVQASTPKVGGPLHQRIAYEHAPKGAPPTVELV